jgi:quinol monooxygenase YgiN
MLKVVAKMFVKDGEKDTVIELARELIEKTRLEDGCISYALCSVKGEENALAFFEEWESQEKLDAHMKSEHFTRIFPILGSHTSAQATISIFTVII